MDGCDTGDKQRKTEPLRADVQAALLEKESVWKARISGWTTPTQAIRHRRITFGGVDFASYTESRSQGSIFFRPDDHNALIPGRIQDIFTVETFDDGARREDVLCVIKRHSGEPQRIPCAPSMLSVFEDFGAQLWPSDLRDQIDIIPFTEVFYHSIGRPWSDNMVVLKPMNRVSSEIKSIHC